MTYISQDIDSKKLMTTKEVGRVLGKSPRTVTRMVLAGDLLNAIKAGDYKNAPLLIPGASVIAYIESKK